MKQRFLYVIGLIILLNINLFSARDYSPEAGRWTAEDPIGFLFYPCRPCSNYCISTLTLSIIFLSLQGLF